MSINLAIASLPVIWTVEFKSISLAIALLPVIDLRTIASTSSSVLSRGRWSSLQTFLLNLTLQLARFPLVSAFALGSLKFASLGGLGS